jgi:hypothetical protein
LRELGSEANYAVPPTLSQDGAIGGIHLLALVCAWRFLLMSIDSGPKLTKENFRKIKEGMSLGEVETIVEAPPRFSSKGPETRHGFSRWGRLNVTCSGREMWINKEAELIAWFDDEGKVLDCSYRQFQPESFLDRIQRLLGL